ncbi:hypothetical protein [Sphingomonas hankookensis]|uniref:hypothetical protein n=1 Tax=Sphingomonas hankookensis TaxID=563996 RepID=UPI003D302653
MMPSPIAAMVADARRAWGDRIVTTDADRIAPWLSDWRGRYHGASAALFEPGDTAQVAGLVALAAQHGVPIVPQGAIRRWSAGRRRRPTDRRCCCRCGGWIAFDSWPRGRRWSRRA